MRIKVLSLLVIIYFINSYTYAQSDLNAYKYITVSKKFEFQKSDDQYQLNSLTKFLLNKEGFKSLFDVETKPQELINNACLNLIFKVDNNSNTLTTKLKVDLVNCNNEVVYTSEGRSKLKEYKKAYHEALRKALEPLKNLNYKYNGESISIVTPIKEVKIIEPTKIKEETPMEVKVTVNEVANEAVKEEVEKIEEVETIEVEAVEAIESLEETVSKSSEIEPIHKINFSESDILYAQITTNGYQLVDSSPKVVYVLQKSSIVDLFILKDKNGIVYKKNGKWLVEYYENNEFIIIELNIKF